MRKSIKFTFQYGYSKTIILLPFIHLISRFTFQYGYSKTGDREIKISIEEKFTFQYGYSKTSYNLQILFLLLHLHSSMVIVKLVVLAPLL